jgi:hypothetical protein
MNASQKSTPVQGDFTLWKVAEKMAITAENNNRRIETAEHGIPRFRKAVFWFLAAALLLLTVFGLSFMPLFLESRLPTLSVFRLWVFEFAMTFAVAGLVAGLREPAFQSMRKAVRAVASSVWWFLALLSFPCAALPAIIALVSLSNPSDFWTTQIMAHALEVSVISLIYPLLATQLTAPLLTTTKRPHLYQSRISQTTWTFTLASMTITLGSGSISLMFFLADNREPNYEIITLVASVGVGVLGTVIRLRVRKIERLEERRTKLLDALGNTLNAFDLRGIGSSEAKRAIHELHRLLVPSPFHSQSISALPHAAAYEITEIIKLVEWATGPKDETEIPRSLTLRAEKEERECNMFRIVIESGKDGVKTHARDFIQCCYQRLLSGAELTQ